MLVYSKIVEVNGTSNDKLSNSLGKNHSNCSNFYTFFLDNIYVRQQKSSTRFEDMH